MRLALIAFLVALVLVVAGVVAVLVSQGAFDDPGACDAPPPAGCA